VISFSRSLSSAERALVILPFSRTAILPGQPVFDQLRRRYTEENITVVTDERGTPAARFLPRCEVIRVAPADFTAAFLPRKEFLQRLLKRRYDVAIDLNLDLVLPSAYICRESGARVRVGFARHRADLFYNFQIHPNPSLGTQRLFERMMTCLQMF
jgi:ADP-heptose:LPS heptosyltransferase